MKKLIKFKKINIFTPFFFFLGFICHSHPRGNDRGGMSRLKILVLSAVILLLITPAMSFAFIRGDDGHNYYNYDQRTVGGNIFGGSSFGGGLFCSGTSNLNFCSVVSYFLGMMEAVIPILFSIAVIFFVWGVFRYVIAEGEDKQVGKNVMIYGIIGLFVMVSVWGLVNVVYNTFGLDNNNYGLNGGINGGIGGGEGTTDSFSEFFGQFWR